MNWYRFIFYVSCTLTSFGFTIVNLIQLSYGTGNIGLALGWCVNFLAWFYLLGYMYFRETK